MLLTITTTHQPATDLGYLLHKNPARIHPATLPFGEAYVYYPQATAQRCTAALQLSIDPIKLVRTYRGTGPKLLEHYVNDRPYTASSFLSVALARVFNTALGGRSKERPGLAQTALALEARLAAVPCRSGKEFIARLFEPLGYQVDIQAHLLNPSDWGQSHYYTITLRGQQRLMDLLRHLYVLLPVLDREKHYWIGDDEVEKLLRHGQDWLPQHPEHMIIAQRYLKYKRRLTSLALAQLAELRSDELEIENSATPGAVEERLEKPLSLSEQRQQSIIAVIQQESAEKVVDLGCGEGKLLARILKETRCPEIIGLDVSSRSLEIAAERLRLDRLPPRQKQRIKLLQGSLLYRDRRITGVDIAIVSEVIEHIDPDRLDAFARALFGYAQPRCVIITTPNIEYNAKFEQMKPGQLRHSDHRFEWTRREFSDWTEQICQQFGYAAELSGIGEVDAALGAPTQMAIIRSCFKNSFDFSTRMY